MLERSVVPSARIGPYALTARQDKSLAGPACRRAGSRMYERYSRVFRGKTIVI